MRIDTDSSIWSHVPAIQLYDSLNAFRVERKDPPQGVQNENPPEYNMRGVDELKERTEAPRVIPEVQEDSFIPSNQKPLTYNRDGTLNY